MSSTNETTILLVGYGWFRNIPKGEINSAEQIARALDGERLSCGGRTARVHSIVVPVMWEGAFPPVEQAVRDLQPQIVLALGTDASAAALRPEPYGVNWCEGTDASPDDPTLETTRSCPIDERGAAYLRGALPFDAMTRAILTEGIPAQTGTLSDAPEGWPIRHRSSAGRYLCNYMAYRLAQLADAAPHPMRTGFLHVPTQPAYAAARRLAQLQAGEAALDALMLPSMPLEMMIRGVRAALCAAVSTEG
ncbi:MAG: hypothetical protein J6K32_05760 [Clostridia bacterium]|nr:hypothetical protein [Clostridia bacterium]